MSGNKTVILTAEENKVLKRIFGTKRDEVKKRMDRLHNEEFHNLYTTHQILLQ
jgi:hypothetical protein